MNIKKWLISNCNSLEGKRVVVTGATGGLGRELIFQLAVLGADITLACRNPQLTNNLIEKIKLDFPKINIDFVSLDLSNIESVNKCIEKLKEYNGIDILINNAGVYNVPVKTLDSGYNNIFQINFLYTYYLTKQLLSELEKKNNSICIALGSIAHNYSKIDNNDIDFSSYKKPSKIYGNSKRFLMFSLYELFESKKVKLAIVHPGVTLTNMTNHYPKAINWLVKIGIKIFFPSPKKACRCMTIGTTKTTPYHNWIGPKYFNIWGAPKSKLLKTCSIEESKKIFEITEKLYGDLIQK